MNLILLEPGDLAPAGPPHRSPDRRAVLHGRRARHVAEVLRATPGQPLRIGLLDGPLGEAKVVRTAAERLELDCRFEAAEPPAGPADVLLLAVPRPKVLARCLEHATALGYARIVLLRSWFVDRSHFQSRVLRPEALRTHLIAGLEQSRRTRLPQVTVEPLFKPFVEDRLDGLLGAAIQHRFVGHPAGDGPSFDALPGPDRPLALAVGPERGFTDYEVRALAARGFVPAALGPHPLRVETALAALSGRLTGRRDRSR